MAAIIYVRGCNKMTPAIIGIFDSFQSFKDSLGYNFDKIVDKSRGYWDSGAEDDLEHECTGSFQMNIDHGRATNYNIKEKYFAKLCKDADLGDVCTCECYLSVFEFDKIQHVDVKKMNAEIDFHTC